MDYQRLTHEEVQEVCRRSNEYGRLVAEVQALRKLAFTYQHGPASNLLTMPRFEDSAALLRKLGEDA